MQIPAVNLNSYPQIRQVNLNFKATLFEDDELGFDGNPYGEGTRNFIREDLYARAFISTRATENPVNCDNAGNIKEVYIANFRDLGNASYSGENLMHHPEYFRLLKASGVTRIIDLIDRPGLKEKCEEFGLDYYSYDAKTGYAGHDIFFKEDSMIFAESQRLAKKGLSKTEYDKAIKKYRAKIESEKNKTILKIKDLIDMVNQGGFYMACEEGDHRTASCLALVSTLNPNWKGEKIEASPAYTLKLRDLYRKLTAEQKQILGIDKKYDKYLKEHFEVLIKKINL